MGQHGPDQAARARTPRFGGGGSPRRAPTSRGRAVRPDARVPPCRPRAGPPAVRDARAQVVGAPGVAVTVAHCAEGVAGPERGLLVQPRAGLRRTVRGGHRENGGRDGGEGAVRRRARVAVHVHSTWSYDGRLSLPEVASTFRRLGYDAVLMAEHDVDFDEDRWEEYRAACARASTDRL